MRASHTYERTAFSLGPIMKCPHPEMVEVLAHGGFDFAVADMEHTPLDPQSLYPMVLAAELHGLNLVIRIPLRNEAYFKWVLDLGVRYVQVPFVQSAADAAEAVRLSHFAPVGGRGLCRFVRAAEFSETPRAAYTAAANAGVRLVLQIEDRHGVEDVEAIAATPGIDTLFVGPYDLSQSLGVPGDVWNPDVVAAIERVAKACTVNGLRLGGFTDSPEGVQRWVDLGATLIEYGSDLQLAYQGGAALRSHFA
jgi:4-hydroxy-2-oxoheptanedioate aldolase